MTSLTAIEIEVTKELCEWVNLTTEKQKGQSVVSLRLP